MPKPTIVMNIEKGIPPPTGTNTRPGSVAEKVKSMEIGDSVLFDMATHANTFAAAVKTHRGEECRTTRRKEGTKIRCWLISNKLDEPVPATGSTETVDAGARPAAA